MKTFKACPFCSSNHFIKYGKYNNFQRYKCKNSSCNKTFSSCTNSLWYNSKKSAELWYKYCNLMFSGKTIRECASKLHISINTAFQWRHKILNKLPNCNKDLYLDGYIGFKHIKLRESFKGQKTPPVYTLNRKKVFVSISVNSNKASFSHIVSKELLNQNISYSQLKNKIKFNSHIVGFLDRYAVAIAKRINKTLMKLKECPLSTELNLRTLANSFSSLLQGWLGFFRGVATKYLDAYLDWFIHIYENSFSNKIMISNIINALFCM